MPGRWKPKENHVSKSVQILFHGTAYKDQLLDHRPEFQSEGYGFKPGLVQLRSFFWTKHELRRSLRWRSYQLQPTLCTRSLFFSSQQPLNVSTTWYQLFIQIIDWPVLFSHLSSRVTLCCSWTGGWLLLLVPLYSPKNGWIKGYDKISNLFFFLLKKAWNRTVFLTY